MAYRFNGSGDRVEFALAPFTGTTFGPFTMAIFYQPAGTLGNRVLGGFTTSADQERFFFNYTGSGGNLRLNSDSGNLIADSSQTAANTSLWYLAVVTWAGGAATPRFHVHDGTSWVHANAASGSAANTGIVSGDKLKVATRNPLSNTTAMDVVCVGIKKTDRTDLQVETLTRTAFSSWTGFGFDWLIGFDTSFQTAGVLQDQASPGTGDEISKVGTSVVSNPAGWSFVSSVTPVADFTGTPLTGTEPLSVTFTDSSTNTPTSWAWTFGDGGTSTAQNPTHSYTAAGTYTVTLQATNSAGSNTKTRTGYVTVSDQPRPIRINTSQGWVDIADATSFVSGTGAPTAAVGATGAIYLNTASGRLYGPKAGGAWPGSPITVPAGAVADATTSSKGILQLAGDLAGTAAAPQVKIPYGTSPPGSPVDGQLWMFPADTTNGVVWMFRYNASGSTYKWEFVGGSAMRSVVATQENTTNTGPVALATGGPSITAPRAGDYEVQFGGFGYNLTAGFGSVMTLYVNGVSTSVSAFGGTNFYTNVSKNTVANAAGAGYGFTLLYSAQGGGTASFGDRWLWLRPVRVS